MYELWKTLSGTYEKKVVTMKIYLIGCLYNLSMKKSDSVQAHLNEYKSPNSQILAQETTIQDELKVMLLMSRFPPSWETFVTTVCNASIVAMKYIEIMSSILTEATRRKSFVHDLAKRRIFSTGFRRLTKQPGKKFLSVPRACPGIIKYVIIVRNLDRLRSIVVASRPKTKRVEI